MFCWFPCFFSWKKPAETHFVLGAAGIVGNQFKFVGLHAVMLCKGFNFIATHVFFAQDGWCRRQNMAKLPQKVMGHLFGLAWTEEVSLRLSVSLFEVQFLGWKIFRWKFRAFFPRHVNPWLGRFLVLCPPKKKQKEAQYHKGASHFGFLNVMVWGPFSNL